MTGEVRLHGIVLSSMPVGEADRRVTILTLERGRITAFAKGARRPKSALLACTSGFTYGEFSLFEGRESYNLVNVTNANYFDSLRTNLDDMYMGLYFCELAGALSREESDDSDLFKLLYVSLLALTKHVVERELIRRVYEIKAIAACGEGMVTDGPYYSRRANGLGAEQLAGSRKVSDSCLYAVRFILSAKPSKLYTFKVSSEVLEELRFIASDYLKAHVDRDFKTIELIDS